MRLPVILFLIIFLIACKKEGAKPAPLPVAFNSVLSFQNATQSHGAGINGTVAAKDPVIKFEFDSVKSLIGLPATANVSVGGTLVIVIDYRSDYDGKPYRFTAPNGKVFQGRFTAGNVAF